MIDPNRTPEQIDLAASELLDRRVDGGAEPPADDVVRARALQMAAAREAVRTPDPHDERVAAELVRAVMARGLDATAERGAPPAPAAEPHRSRVSASVLAAVAAVAVVVLGGAVLLNRTDSGDESAGVAEESAVEDAVSSTSSPSPTTPPSPTTLATGIDPAERGGVAAEAPAGATADAGTGAHGTDDSLEVEAADAPATSSAGDDPSWAVRQVFKGWLGGGATPTPRPDP